MRRLLACLALALAALPGCARATMMPPLHGVQPGPRFIPTAAPEKKKASCSEHGRSKKAARLAKKVAPVACEQPPRPKVANTTFGFIFGR